MEKTFTLLNNFFRVSHKYIPKKPWTTIHPHLLAVPLSNILCSPLCTKLYPSPHLDHCTWLVEETRPAIFWAERRKCRLSSAHRPGVSSDSSLGLLPAYLHIGLTPKTVHFSKTPPFRARWYWAWSSQKLVSSPGNSFAKYTANSIKIVGFGSQTLSVSNQDRPELEDKHVTRSSTGGTPTMFRIWTLTEKWRWLFGGALGKSLLECLPG